MDYLKREIKNFLDYFPQIVPQAATAPKIFLGMSFGGVLGLFIVQNPKSEDWFDHYIFMETPTYEFKGIIGDTIYAKLEELTYLNHKIYFIFGSLDQRIYGGHDAFFLKKIRNKDLVKVDYMENVGHDLPMNAHPVVEEILDYCNIH